MRTILRAGVIAALLSSAIAVPAMAQHRPQPNHGPQRPSWHEVQSSHGHKWRKGQKIARNQQRYVVNDWRTRGLRQPPRGYQWVRENNNSGDFLLVAAATGLIASILSQ
ncbi:MAG: putative rane protein [Sphingomonas bacterium]|jgi:Ni/Co efflux regulator RcnB|uniref:RcnB family protein n=1 Tax=Sphingomonas bacterium TaxID=1895847 RepID=UPI0026178D77|nr:RcnB family protein [Sphingomonas bacterium]MDB5707680.1 putative rane protein [Sphingomonas bacterium]